MEKIPFKITIDTTKFKVIQFKEEFLFSGVQFNKGQLVCYLRFDTYLPGSPIKTHFSNNYRKSDHLFPEVQMLIWKDPSEGVNQYAPECDDGWYRYESYDFIDYILGHAPKDILDTVTEQYTLDFFTGFKYRKKDTKKIGLQLNDLNFKLIKTNGIFSYESTYGSRENIPYYRMKERLIEGCFLCSLDYRLTLGNRKQGFSSPEKTVYVKYSESPVNNDSWKELHYGPEVDLSEYEADDGEDITDDYKLEFVVR